MFDLYRLLKNTRKMSANILGSYLSVITKANSRYEGTLTEVDRVKKTMSLRDVRNMGTEGRRDGVNEIPRAEGILGNVKFRVDLIASFEIIKKPTEESQNEEEDDPAIVESQTPEVEEDEDSEIAVKKKKDDWSRG